MTKAHAPIASSDPQRFGPISGRVDLWQENRELRAELERLEPVVGAALLTATAFRLRDHAAMISALRLLVRATRAFEDAEACV